MKRFFYGLLCSALAASPAGAGSMTLLGIGKPTAVVAGFTGPGDVYAFTAWYGLRAYSAAKRGTKAINLCDDTGTANCTDILTDATTGKLNAGGTHGTNNCDTSGTCKIKIIYDQTGGNACAGSCDVTTSTVAAMPVFTPNAIGSLPGMTVSGSQILLSVGSLTQASPLTVSAVAKHTGAAGLSPIISDNFTAGGFGFGSAASTATIYSSGYRDVAASDNVFHALQFLSTTTANGASIQVDATPNTGLNSETGAWSGVIGIGSDPSGSFKLTGVILETGVASGNQTGSNTTMCHNQFLYWGTPTSC